MLFEKGTYVFLPDENECYVPGRVSTTFEKGKVGVVALLDTGRNVKITAKQSMLTQPMDKQSLQRWPDMVFMKQLDNASLLHNLRQRYEKDEIYTSIGSILVSLNPYKQLPGLYGPEMVDKFIASSGNLTDLPPHIYGIAEDCYFQMIEHAEDMSCVITGESGAGKTEATKLFMQYISERSRRNRGLTVEENALAGKREFTVPIREQILGSNPLLEAFGNAKTVRNDNSSRYGKLIDLHFARSRGAVAGGAITNYLLEKSRVVRHLEGERSYHVFYQLTAAANQLDPALKKKYKLLEADQYYFLNQSITPSTMIDGVDDARDWEETIAAMKLLKMADSERDSVMRILSGILHLGNITFETTGNTDFACIAEDESLALAAEMFGVTPEELERGLLTRDISNKSETVIQKHNVREAGESRDALAKHTYSRLFNWLTMCINRALSSHLDSVKASDVSTISVLDIFGFESFGHNSFEQLCINYCNEKLQGFFNAHVFKLEQEEYMREEIDVSQIGFSDNEGVIATIDHRSTGILAICDDEVNLLRGTDDGFLAKVLQAARNNNSGKTQPPARKKSITAALLSGRKNSTHQAMGEMLNKRNALEDKIYLKEPDVKAKRDAKARNSFIIVHFAGEVMYNVDGFLEKNRDVLRKDLTNVVAGSSIELVSQLFGIEEYPTSSSSSKRAVSVKGKQLKKTLGRKFQEQLDELMLRLNATEPHFVRTIKPNAQKKPDIFEAPLTLDQLRYAGLLEVCRIRQLGYPVRKLHEEFFRLFCCIHPEAADLDSLLEALVEDQILTGSDWQKGKTKVFMRANQFDALTRAREKALWNVLTLMQRQTRRFLARTRYLRTKTAFEDLERGIETRDRRLLETSIPFAVSLPNASRHAALVEKAKRVLGEVKEEEKLIEMLREAVSAKDVSALPSLIDSAHKKKLGSHEIVVAAEELVKRDRKEKKAIKDLQTAIQDAEIAALIKALAQIDDLGISTPEVRTARALLDRLEKEQSLLDELEIAIEDKDLDRMEDLVQSLVDIGSVDHPLVKKAQKMMKNIVQASEERKRAIELLELDLINAIESRDLDTLNRLRERIEKLGHKGPIVEEAMLLREQLEARDSLLKRLATEVSVLDMKARSIDGLVVDDLDPLESAIDECKDHDLSEAKEPEVHEAVRFLARMKRQLEVQDQLEEALEENTYPVLLDALLAAQSLAMETANARRVAEEVRNLEKIRLALSRIDERRMREKRMSLLRYATKEEQEAVEQDRLESMNTSKYKALMEDCRGTSKYELQNFYRIRDPDDYTEGFRYHEREDQAALMLWSTKSPIPKSIHEVDEDQSIIAVRCNRAILQYCGDITATNEASLAQYVVIQGLSDPRVADEIYIQLLKHLRGNNSQKSEEKAWLLLCMCTKYFPTSDVLTPYVLYFLMDHRNYPKLVGNFARLCTAQLGSTRELGPSKFKPSLSELNHYALRPPILLSVDTIDEKVVSLPVSPDMRFDITTKLVRQATGVVDAVTRPAWAIFCKDLGVNNNDGLRDRLVRFYKLYNTSKLEHIEVYISHWRGRDEELFAKLVEQYGPEPAYSTMSKRERFDAFSKPSGLSLPITVARRAGKMMRNVQTSKTKGPSPKIAWPLPTWVFPGDVYARMAAQNREPAFVFKRRVLPSKGRADIQLYQQLRHDYLSAGSLVVSSESDVAELAVIALVLKDNDIDIDDDEALLEAGLSKEIPVSWLEEKPASWFAKQIVTMVDLPPGGDQSLRERYCELLRRCPSYGMGLYSAIRADSKRVYVIGIDMKGISILSPDLTSVVRHFPHSSIRKFGAAGGVFWMKLAKSKLEKEGKTLGRRISRHFGGSKPADIKQISKGLAKTKTFDFLKRSDGIDVVLNTIQSWEAFDQLWTCSQTLKEEQK